MNWLNNHLLKLRVWKDTQGQDLVEYALMAGMIAVAAVAFSNGLGTALTALLTKITDKLNAIT